MDSNNILYNILNKDLLGDFFPVKTIQCLQHLTGGLIALLWIVFAGLHYNRLKPLAAMSRLGKFFALQAA